MARHGLSRPQGEISRQSPIPHDRWQTDRLSGTLRLTLSTPPGQYVSPGTGRLVLTEKEGTEIVAQQAARAAGHPVIPGSGIKGAVRTLYELLSFSCDPFAATDRSRRHETGVYCTRQSCCEACSLFGLLGWNGRVGFSDAVPVRPDSVQVNVENVPIPWTPDASKTPGDFRLYDLEEARMLDPDRKVWMPRPKELAREVFRGDLETQMTFWNVSREELGRLLLTMGLGPEEGSRFHLRLGGVKYDGKGGVQVKPQAIRLTAPERETLEGKDSEERCANWIDAAQNSPWASTFWPHLEELASSLQTTKLQRGSRGRGSDRNFEEG